MNTAPLAADTIVLVALSVAFALIVAAMVYLLRLMFRPLPRHLQVTPLDTYDVIGAAEWIAAQCWNEEEAV